MAWLDTIENNATVETSKRCYSQCLESKLVPAVTVDGVPVSWWRQKVILDTTETVTEVRGLSKTKALGLANTVEARRVNEADGWRVTKTEKSSSIHSTTST